MTTIGKIPKPMRALRACPEFAGTGKGSSVIGDDGTSGGGISSGGVSGSGETGNSVGVGVMGCLGGENGIVGRGGVGSGSGSGAF